jgi:hypothetical protein
MDAGARPLDVHCAVAGALRYLATSSPSLQR